MEDVILQLSPEQDYKNIWNEIIKQAALEKLKEISLDDTIISLNDVIILPEATNSEDFFQNWNYEDWLNHRGEEECFYFETFTENDIVEEMDWETDSVLSSSDALSLYCLDDNSNPQTGSPYMLFIEDDSDLDEAPQGKLQTSHPSLNRSPESERADSGIVDINGSVSKSNSDGSASWEDFISCFENVDLEEAITEQTEIIEIFNKKEADFWYSSDDGERFNSDNECYGIYVYSPDKKRTRKTRRRRKKRLMDIKRSGDSEENVLDTKKGTCMAMRKKLSQYRRELWKNSSMGDSIPHDRWCNKTEKAKEIREREKNKRKLKQMFCKKEVQNANYNQSRLSRNRNRLLPDYFY